jgi:hypothetical protein
MTHNCPNCGETFETLDEFAEHPCAKDLRAGESKTSGQTNPFDDPSSPGQMEISEIDTELAKATSGDSSALHAALSIYNQELEEKREKGDGRHSDIYWEYFEPLADCLDEHAQEDGWALLSEFTAVYGPTEDGKAPGASGVVENAVGRYVITTRFSEGVEGVAAGALEYLRSFGESESAASEESFVYGWGIGHERHSVSDHLHSMAQEHYLWVGQTLEQAFYADQESAIELLERLVRDDDISFTWPHDRREGVGADRFFLSTVAHLDSDGEEYRPRFWGWRNDFDYSFEWKPETRNRIRNLVEESEVLESADEPWTFEELDPDF